MEEIIYLLVMCAVVVGIFYAYISYDRSHKTSEPPSVVETEPKKPPQEPVQVSLDSQTEDEKYAEVHHMWICEYCETLNSIPEGTIIKKVATVDHITSDGTGSLLRGDLVRAQNKVPQSMKMISKELICAACGKSQQSITI